MGTGPSFCRAGGCGAADSHPGPCRDGHPVDNPGPFLGRSGEQPGGQGGGEARANVWTDR